MANFQRKQSTQDAGKPENPLYRRKGFRMDNKLARSVRDTLAAVMDTVDAQTKAAGKSAKAQAKAVALLAKAETELTRARADAEAATARAKHLATRAALAEKTRDERAKAVADGLPRSNPARAL